MRIAHLADNHIGYPQFGLEERDADFARAFEKAVDEILARDVDLVLHSGDLFEKPSPRIAHLDFIYSQARRLKDAGIPMFCILGNHDRPRVFAHHSAQSFLAKLGVVHLLSPAGQADFTVWNDTFIAGISYNSPESTENAADFWEQAFAELEEHARLYPIRLMMLHQGIAGLMPPIMPSELSLESLPKNFHYIALGHIHFPALQPFGGGFIAYPGSTEPWRWEELRNKDFGFYIVEVEENKVNVERVGWKSQRLLLQKRIYAPEELEELCNIVEQERLLPIVDLSFPVEIQAEIQRHHKYEILQKSCLRLFFHLEAQAVPSISFEPNLSDPSQLFRQYFGQQALEESLAETLTRLSASIMENWQEQREVVYQMLQQYLKQ